LKNKTTENIEKWLELKTKREVENTEIVDTQLFLNFEN